MSRPAPREVQASAAARRAAVPPGTGRHHRPRLTTEELSLLVEVTEYAVEAAWWRDGSQGRTLRRLRARLSLILEDADDG